MVSSFFRVLLSLALALAVAFGSSWRQVLVVCGMDGETRSACCCDHEPALVDTITVAKDGCCDQVVFQAEILPVGDRYDHPEQATTALASTPAQQGWPRPAVVASRVIAPTGARGPPEPPTPLYIQVCSLLI